VDRRVMQQASATDRRPDLPGARGFVAVLLALVLPLSLLAAGTSVLPGDVAMTRMVQTQLPSFLEPLVIAGNVLGLAPVLIAIALFTAGTLAAKGHRQLALLVASASLAQLANVMLKLTLESPRPTSNLVLVSEDATGYGFPSGHTMGTTVIALMLFYVVTRLMAPGVMRRVVLTTLLFVPFMTGIARIETGAHWPSDVLGAWLWGTLAAIAILTYAPRTFDMLPALAARLRTTRALGRTATTSDIRSTTP